MLAFPVPDPLCGDTLIQEIEAALGLAPGTVRVGVEGTTLNVAGADDNPTAVQQTVSAHTGTLPPDVQNAATLRQKAATALTNNQTYLGIASPTNVQVRDQVAALTRQIDGVIRLLLNQLDSTSGT